MTTPKPQDVPEAPAVIQADHVQDRPYFTEVGAGKHKRSIPGAQMAFRRASVLQRAKMNKQLMDRSLCVDDLSERAEEFKAEERYFAGKRFTEAWLLSTAGNWASGADLNRVRVAGVPGSFVDHALSEKLWLEDMRRELGVNDWMILRRVCGENCPIAEVVTAITASYRHSTLSRFREALDSLIVAMGDTDGR